MQESKIKYDDFFYSGEPIPINRIAYSKEDAEYKLKCIKAMMEIDHRIQITIDEIGNICATFPAKHHLVNSKSIVAGSHTDSVRDGGQFDGSLGVYFAMKSLEELAKRERAGKLDMYTDYKAVIFACEESTRFNMACIGSSYLANSDYVKNEDGEEYNYLESLCNKKDCLKPTDAEPNQGNLGKAIETYKKYLQDGFDQLDLDKTRIKFVDRILEPNEVDQLFEGHIEQSQQLVKQQILESAEYKDDPTATDFTMAPKPSIVLSKLKTILGGVTAIGKPVRGSIDVRSTPNTNPIVTAAHLILNNRTLGVTSQKDSIRTSIPEFNSFDENDQYETLQSDEKHTYYKIVCKGESNHSGGTPMPERRDSNVGMSELITTLESSMKDNDLKFDFHAVKTPVYGMNQIQDYTILYLSSSVPLIDKDGNIHPLLSAMYKCNEEKHGVTFETSKAESFAVPKSKHFVELKDDMRQNGIATAKTTLQKFHDLVIKPTYEQVGVDLNENPNLIEFTELSKGDPIMTSQELLEDFVNICKRKGVKCTEILSYPGHDCAVALPKFYNGIKVTGKRFLMFIPSIFGSHNPDEQTWAEAVETGSTVFTDLVTSRFKFLERQAYNFMIDSSLARSRDPQAKVREFGTNNEISQKSQEFNSLMGRYKTAPELNPDEKQDILDRLFE